MHFHKKCLSVHQGLKHDNEFDYSKLLNMPRISLKCVIQNLCAGDFMNETNVIPLVELLHDPDTCVQVWVYSMLVIMFSLCSSLLKHNCGHFFRFSFTLCLKYIVIS